MNILFFFQQEKKIESKVTELEFTLKRTMGKRNISESMEFPVPASKRPKLTGFDFYTKTLGAPKLIVRFVFHYN